MYPLVPAPAIYLPCDLWPPKQAWCHTHARVAEAGTLNSDVLLRHCIVLTDPFCIDQPLGARYAGPNKELNIQTDGEIASNARYFIPMTSSVELLPHPPYHAPPLLLPAIHHPHPPHTHTRPCAHTCAHTHGTLHHLSYCPAVHHAHHTHARMATLRPCPPCSS